MSQWTHVNASIRFDGILDSRLPTEEQLGEIIQFEDEDYNTILPCGSEGSIEYAIYRNPRGSSLAAMVVTWWGDLRDYNDVDEIMNYFNKIIVGRSIRSGIIEIDVEYGFTYVYKYHPDDHTFDLIHKIKEG